MVVVEEKGSSRRSAIDRDRAAGPAIRLDGVGRRLGEHRQNLHSLQNGKVGRLADVLYEPLEKRRGDVEQPLLARARREREEFPTQPVPERRRITVDEATLGQYFERPRYLTLLPSDKLGDPDDPQPPILDRFFPAKNRQYGKFPPEVRFFHSHHPC